MDEDDLTPEELAEAEELARALERGAGDGAPDDALSAAALLRFSVDAAELSDERRDAIFEEVLATARPRRPEAAKMPSWLRWLLPGVGLATAAAAVALLVARPEAPTTAAALPSPEAALLSAQAGAAAGDADQARALGEHMKTYRGSVYAALSERYER